MVELGQFARLINGRAYKQEELLSEGPTPVLRVGNFFSNRGWYYSNLELEADKYCNAGDLLYAWSASFGPRIWEGPRAIYHYHIWKVEPTEAIDKMFLFHLLAVDSEKIKFEGHGIAMVHATKGGMEQRKFPLPPLEVQKEIVAEIEGYQKVINGARAVLDHYRPHIPIHPDWPMVPLGDIADVKLGKMLDQAKHQKGEVLPYARNVSVRWGTIDTHDLPEMYFEEDELERFGLGAGDVLVCEGGEPGRAAVWDGRIQNLKYQKALHRVRFKVPFEPSMLVFLLQEMALTGALVGWLSGTTIKHLTLESFNKLPIPLPPLATQQALVAEIEAEQALVAANRELMTRFEQKIQATLARIWGES